MNTSDLQTYKLDLIAWILKLQDASLIEKLVSIQEENIEIPEAQKNIVRERLNNTRPEEYLTWEEVEAKLKTGK